MGKARFLRDLLPSWHIREREFRDWYEKLVDQCEFTSDRDYLRWAEVLNTPEPVTGYREVRYPKMESAKRKAEFLLSLDPEKFDPDAGKQDESVVHLPIVTVGAR
jgi:indolepyruvate ferredoxin oxidoreductase